MTLLKESQNDAHISDLNQIKNRENLDVFQSGLFIRHCCTTKVKLKPSGHDLLSEDATSSQEYT